MQLNCIAVIEGTFEEGGADTKEFKEYLKKAIADDEAHGGTELQQLIMGKLGVWFVV